MIGIGIGVQFGRVLGTSYDADAQAFFDRVTAAGGTLTTTEANATNQLVLDMKSAGVWTSMKAVYPMVGASAAACAQNLVSSSFTGAFTSGWTYASTGVTPNGTNAYMNTFLSPFVQMSNFSLHHSVYTRTLYGNLQGIGIFSPTRVDMIVSSSTIYSNIGNAGTATATNSISLLLASRTTATLNKLYTRGILRNTDATLLNVALPNANYYIGAENQVTPNFYSNTEIALSSLGDGLSDTQAANFYTAVQAFQTTLSRQV
jgi:hypothetical protein